MRSLEDIILPMIFTHFRVNLKSYIKKSDQRKLLPDFFKNNYFEGAALILVRSINTIDELWSRLKEAYGDTELLLGNKLQDIVKMGEIWKIRNKQKLVQALSEITPRYDRT